VAETLAMRIRPLGSNAWRPNNLKLSRPAEAGEGDAQMRQVRDMDRPPKREYSSPPLPFWPC